MILALPTTNALVVLPLLFLALGGGRERERGESGRLKRGLARMSREQVSACERDSKTETPGTESKRAT